MTRIISAFPGTGKTYFHTHKGPLATADSDSSHFSWISKGVRHPEFPANYIEHINDLMGKVDYIFVSSHQDVRNALTAALHLGLPVHQPQGRVSGPVPAADEPGGVHPPPGGELGCLGTLHVRRESRSDHPRPGRVPDRRRQDAGGPTNRAIAAAPRATTSFFVNEHVVVHGEPR